MISELVKDSQAFTSGKKRIVIIGNEFKNIVIRDVDTSASADIKFSFHAPIDLCDAPNDQRHVFCFVSNQIGTDKPEINFVKADPENTAKPFDIVCRFQIPDEKEEDDDYPSDSSFKELSFCDHGLVVVSTVHTIYLLDFDSSTNTVKIRTRITDIETNKLKVSVPYLISSDSSRLMYFRSREPSHENIDIDAILPPQCVIRDLENDTEKIHVDEKNRFHFSSFIAERSGKIIMCGADGKRINIYDQNMKFTKGVYRGKQQAKIRDVAFNHNGSLMCVLSSRQTVHIYSMTALGNRRNFLSVFGDYVDFLLERDFARHTLNKEHQYDLCAFTHRDDVVLLGSESNEEDLRLSFEREKGGECSVVSCGECTGDGFKYEDEITPCVKIEIMSLTRSEKVKPIASTSHLFFTAIVGRNNQQNGFVYTGREWMDGDVRDQIRVEVNVNEKNICTDNFLQLYLFRKKYLKNEQVGNCTLMIRQLSNEKHQEFQLEVAPLGDKLSANFRAKASGFNPLGTGKSNIVEIVVEKKKNDEEKKEDEVPKKKKKKEEEVEEENYGEDSDGEEEEGEVIDNGVNEREYVNREDYEKMVMKAAEKEQEMKNLAGLVDALKKDKNKYREAIDEFRSKEQEFQEILARLEHESQSKDFMIRKLRKQSQTDSLMESDSDHSDDEEISEFYSPKTDEDYEKVTEQFISKLKLYARKLREAKRGKARSPKLSESLTRELLDLAEVKTLAEDEDFIDRFKTITETLENSSKNLENEVGKTTKIREEPKVDKKE